MSFTTYGFGSTPTSSGGFAATRGRISGSFPYGVNYPSPFFDVAHTYLPTTVKQLFRYCRYYFLTNPLVNATVFKLSEYPVTDIIIDHEDPQVKKRWTEYYHDHLRYRSFEVETGLDYHCYGTCPVSVGFPFQKYLTCSACGWSERADKIRNHWTFTNFEFRLSCPKCGSTGEAKVKDRYLKNANGIHLLRWNVEDVEVTYNDITGQSTYFYTVPGPLKADIVIGKKDVVQQIPQIFIQALRQQKGVIFSKENLFVLKRPTLAWQDRGWGVPLLLPVLKDTFYLQLMKKAQEAILLEHIVPLRVLFPQAASGSSDPFTTINLTDWRDQVAAEIARWRFDNNYIPIMPLPVGQQTIGGDGRALLLFNEIQTLSEHIIMGMGVPREFLMGGMSYAGTNVSMRMLENAFISYVGRQRLLANWVMKTIAHFMEWPEVHIRFKPFKMADDIQRKAYLFQMNQAGKISDHTLASDSDLDQDEEDEMLIRETEKRLEATKKQQLAMAQIQGEAQMIMSKFQIKSQQAMMEAQGAPQAPGEPGGPEAAMGVGAAQQQAAMGPAMPGEAAAGSTAPPQAGSQLGAGQDLGVPQQQAQAGGAPMGADLMQMAQMYAQQISQMPPDQQQMAVQNLAAQSPELAQLVQQLLSAMGARGAVQPPSGVDMRPLPDKLPPRRTAPMV